MENYYNVKRLALVLAIQADIEAMKTENDLRKIQGFSPAYGESSFWDKGEELRNLAYTPDDCL